MNIKRFLNIVFITLCTLNFLSCATKPNGLIDFSNVPTSKYRIREIPEENTKPKEASISDMVVDTSTRDAENITKSSPIVEPQHETSHQENEKTQQNNTNLIPEVSLNNQPKENLTESDLLRDFGVDSGSKKEVQTIEETEPELNKKDTKVSQPIESKPNEKEETSLPATNEAQTQTNQEETPEVILNTDDTPAPQKISYTGFEESTILFLPLKDTSISISLLSSRIRSMFAYEMPDTIAFTGVAENQQKELSSLFGEYKAYNTSDATILLKNTTKDSPILAENTHIITYATKDKYNEEELSGVNYDTKSSNNYEALYRALSSYKNTPVILLLSPNERSYEDFSSWTSPSRTEAQNKWTLISTLSDLGYYDVIENGRWNSSSSGTSYTDWTYKSEDAEMRLDFMMLKDVAVEDAYTIDIADYSTSTGVKRRGILAHLVLANEQ